MRVTVNQPIQHILFIELLGGLGDVLIALPAIQALAISHPQASMTVLTFAPGGELLLHHPHIHTILYAKPGEVRASLDRLLRAHHFDLIVSDTNYDGIADVIQASCAERVVTNLWRNPPPNERVSDRFLSILESEGLITATAAASQRYPKIWLTPAERQQAQQAIGPAFRPLICLCPDAGMAIKRWSGDYFVTLGQALQTQTGATIVVPVGGDQQQAERLVHQIGGNAQLWPRGSLRQLAALLSHTDLMIAADTGPARIAAAQSIPTMTLFGPSWADRYGQPYPHLNFQGYPDCPHRNIANFTEQDCWYSGTCPYDWDTCVNTIAPETVLNAALSLLPSRSSQFPIPSPSLDDRMNHGSSTGSLPGDTINRVATNPWKAVKKILAMRLDNIGDVIMTGPALRSIRENLPEAHITLMASPAGAQTAPLLPWINEVLPWRTLWQDLGRLPFEPYREWELIETLQAQQFDAAIIFTSFSQSPYPAALASYLANIPLRLGESRELELELLTDAPPPAPDQIHQVDRNLRLLEWVGFEVQDSHLALHVPTLQRPAEPYLLITPWTSCQARNFDLNRFAEAAFKLSQISGLKVVVCGMAKERELASPLLAKLGDRAIDLIGRTRLEELVSLVAGARLVLTNNTSTMHIADATQTPMVVLFAGTELNCQWQPRRAPHRLLQRPTVCSPCYALTCPYQLQCLDILPDQVVAAGLELLQQSELVPCT